MKTKAIVLIAVLLYGVFAQAQDKETRAGSRERERIRRHLVREDSDYPYPFFDSTPRIYDVSAAPDDPNLYLGKLIRYEWQGEEYPSELYAKVAELTFGLTDDYAKLKAIADWVKLSKKYEATIYDFWPPSIADIWKSETGVCADAALELAAMLRVAKIPAMTFDSLNRWHTAVRAYISGRWIIADATFNPGPAIIYEANDYRFIAGFQERPLGTLRNVAIPGTEEKLDNLTFFSYELVVGERDKYKSIGLDLAKLAFPVSNEFLYFDPDTKTFTSDRSKQKIYIYHRIDGQDNSCLNDKGSWYANSLGFIVPGIGWRTTGYNRSSCSVSNEYSRGYVVTSLPTCGKYRVIYAFNNGDLNSSQDGQALAYAEAWLYSDSGVTVVTPSDLQPMPGANMYYFTALVETLSKLPTYEQLGGKR
jgi:hypothetical protein